MKPSDYYRMKSAEIREADVRLIAAIMSEYVGENNAVSLPVLCRRSGFGERQVRDMLETLRRDYGVPIGSHSGKAGRWIIANEQERSGVVAELVSRRESLDAVIRGIREARLPAETRSIEATQPALIEIVEERRSWPPDW